MVTTLIILVLSYETKQQNRRETIYPTTRAKLSPPSFLPLPLPLPLSLSLPLCIQVLLLHFTIPLAPNRTLLQNLTQLLQLPIAQLHYSTVLFYPLNLGRARDGDRALSAHPADSDLRQRYLFAFRHLANGLDEFEVLREILGLEAGKHTAEIS